MKKEPKVIYYSDELNDEFSGANIVPRKIDKNYPYEGGRLRKIGHVFGYHMIAIPLACLFLFLKYRHKVINGQVIKKTKGSYFLYGNHTNVMADPLIPTVVNRFRDMYVIVHPDNVSMPVLGKLTPSMGALPLPDDGDAAKNFMKCLKSKVENGYPVTIYPEAHIWPYYTGIRKFKDTSFGYPIQYNVPVYCFTNTYQKRKYSKNPKLVTYVDGPFYAESSLSRKEQKEELGRLVYETMLKRSKNSNVEIVRYVKAENARREEKTEDGASV